MARFSLLLPVVVAASAFTFGVSAHADPFEVKENNWEGCSELLQLARSELGDARVIPVSQLDWSELGPTDGILLMHPDHAISSEKLAAFLGAGGRVGVVDDFGAGDKILERFQIERVPAPAHPLSTLRHNADLAIAEPVREPLPNHTSGVHATVEDVERLITNHPTGLRNPKLTPVLKIRSEDGPDVLVALAGNFGSPPKGKLFAMGDPSALMNQMLRYPGNRAFALGLIRYLVDTSEVGPHPPRLFIITNRFSESGSYAGVGGVRSEIDSRLESAGHELGRLLQEGFAGIFGLAFAALITFGIGMWTTSVSSRTYRLRHPSFARPVPLVAQGGTAGRAAVLAASSTPRALAVLELKSALEEGMAQELGFASWVSTARLLEAITEQRALDEPRYRALKETLLEMANVETRVAAGLPGRVKKAVVLRLSAQVSDLLQAVRQGRRERAIA